MRTLDDSQHKLVTTQTKILIKQHSIEDDDGEMKHTRAIGGTLSSRFLNLRYLGPKISIFYRLGNAVSCITFGTFVLGKISMLYPCGTPRSKIPLTLNPVQ